jgi:GNAT superfamily N-acetyltransferase
MAAPKLCLMMPGLERFLVTKALQEDIQDIQKLLQSLTSRAAGTLTELPKGSQIFVARDTLTPNQDIVGTVAYHTWDQLRPSPAERAGYIQDLVVAKQYRGLGIGTRLLTEAKGRMREEGASKITLAYASQETSPVSPLHSFYGGLGFLSVGVYMVQYLPYTSFDTELLANEGDWLYGQHLVEKFGKDETAEVFVLSPPYRIVDSASLSENSLEGLSGSYAVKFSRAGQDFTGGGVRGGNTSRGRRINMDKPEQALKALKGFSDNAPSDARKIALQRFIDQTGGCLFHAEASKHQNEVELLWEANTCTGRYYTLFKEGRWIGDESIQGIGQGFPLNWKEAGRDILKHLTKLLTPLQNSFGTETWSIEGFWNPSHGKITILQLRPTPLDRPLGSAPLPQNIFYETYFVWGDFKTRPFVLQEKKWPDEIVVSKDPWALKLPTSLLERLKQGKKTLFVHQERGFALSHEPWFLPPPELREHFGFLYIPGYTTEEYTGQKVQFLSSGGKGYGSLCM